MAQECVSLYPNSTVTIYDLPKVVQVAREQFISPEEHQINFHEGKCVQWSGGVTAVAPGPWLCSEVSSCPFWGQCHRLQPPQPGSAAVPAVHRQLSETQLIFSATLIPEENYFISYGQGYISKKAKHPAVLKSVMLCFKFS